MDKNYTKHYSVMLDDCLKALHEVLDHSTSTQFNFADMTFGGGGHSIAFAESFKASEVYCVDQDDDAIENAKIILKQSSLENRVHLNKMNYESFPEWIEKNHSDIKFNAIIMDLGVSSHHFDKDERGFSFRNDAKLDMRMDHTNENLSTVAEVLNELDEESIANIIYKYGEEGFSRRIAKEIVDFRKDKKIETTKELENIVFHSYPKNLRHKKTHPATKTFQALRIYVNRELEVLENSLLKLFDVLAPDGILMVISFHSLEDRIVKHSFKEIFQTNKNIAKILTKKPIYPSEKEVGENSRSRSAKLRILQRIDCDAQGGVGGKKGKKKTKFNS